MSIRLPIILLSATALAACATVEETGSSSNAQQVGSATLSQANGQSAGTARLLSDGEQVTLEVAVTGIAPGGTHGFHLHTTGLCEGPGFTSAGGHLNPYDRDHGHLNPDGSHLGDLPNLQVDASGNARLTVPLDGAADRVLANIFDADGTAIVVHADADDYRTDPTGNAGDRIACGAMQASR